MKGRSRRALAWFILHPSAFILLATHSPRVDVHHRGTAAELAAHLANEVVILHGGAVDADLLRAGLDESGGVLQGANTAAHGEGHEDHVGDAPHHLFENGPPL